tara:strand:+ start:3113 stop:3835 length:723 start_codon:yes stop_codon:yes gene_type:complete
LFFLYPFLIFFLDSYFFSYLKFSGDLGLILGPSANLSASWIGTQEVDENIPILILAGHADSQGLAGAGTLGEAVDKYGKSPMNPEISDELFWNLKLQSAIVQLGQRRGLNIKSYDPGVRNIEDANDPRTNWSVGKEFVKDGGYAIEIHFDSYGKYGVGAGLIPPFFDVPNKIDESLAMKFGRFPISFRGGLGAPRRQIRILEIGKLEGDLEQNLRNLKTSQRTIKFIAHEIVEGFLNGIQ